MSSQLDGVSGTRLRILELRSSTACRLGGFPSVTPLDQAGAIVAVPIEQDQSDRVYPHPVAVGNGAVAVLQLGWSSAWCAAPVDVASLRLGLPDGGGSLTVAGFGGSACNAPTENATTTPIWVSTFWPQDYVESQPVTAFHDLTVEARLPATVAVGGEVRFQVVLTAPPGPGIDLAICPDYLVTLADRSWSYALNCAAVPHRNAQGQPYLPGGTPVVFDMRLAAPSAPDPAAKVTWRLRVAGVFAAGGEIEIR